MRRPDHTKWNFCAALLAALALAPVGMAATESNTLVSSVPPDVFLCVVGKHNPERAFLDQYWGEVIAAAKESGVGDEAMSLISSAMGEGEKAEMDRLLAKAKSLFAGVKWKELVTKEFVFAERMPVVEKAGGNINMGPPDFLLMFRGDAAAATQNFEGLVALVNGALEEVKAHAEGAPPLVLARSEVDGAKLAILPLFTPPNHEPWGLTMALRDDVIIVAMGEKLGGEALTLLAKKDAAGGLAGSERFKTAMSKLPASEDSLVFFDMQRLMAPIRDLVTTVIENENKEKPADAAAAPAPDYSKLANRLLSVPEMVDYVATVEHTDGFSTYSNSYVALTAGAEKNDFYPVFGKPAEKVDFAKFLPEETLSFSVSSGCDLSALYTFLIDTVRGVGPDGEHMLTEWNNIQQTAGFNVQTDVLDWFGGNTTSVTLKGGTEFAFFLSVKDEARAREKTSAAVKAVADMLAEQAKTNPMLAMMAVRTTPVQDERLKGFEYITVGMNPQPMVWGVAEGHVIFGSSANTVVLCLDTAKGTHPNVRKNARVMEEALIPEGAFTSVSLSDQRGIGQQIAAGLGMMSMISGMMTMAVPDPDARAAVSKVAGLLVKLAPAAAKIDFYKSKSSLSVFDGKGWACRGATRYASPPERPSAASASPTASAAPTAEK